MHTSRPLRYNFRSFVIANVIFQSFRVRELIILSKTILCSNQWSENEEKRLACPTDVNRVRAYTLFAKEKTLNISHRTRSGEIFK